MHFQPFVQVDLDTRCCARANGLIMLKLAIMMMKSSIKSINYKNAFILTLNYVYTYICVCVCVCIYWRQVVLQVLSQPEDIKMHNHSSR